MNYTRNIILFLLSLICAQAYCQNISVKSFRLLENDLTANTAGTTVLDQNGDKAALVKVVTTQTGFSFDCGSIGVVKTEQKPSEIWVYVPQGARRITISHPQLGILRDYEFSMPIERARTYEMVLTTGKVQTLVQQDAGGQYLILRFQPKSAIIKIDDVEIPSTDGAITKFLTYGNHNYSVSDPLYYDETGTINIATERKELNISLKPNFGFLALTTIPENGAKVTIDNEEKPSGITPFNTGKLIKGVHKFRFQMPQYETKDTSIFVNDDGAVHNQSIYMHSNFGTVKIRVQKGSHIYINNEDKGDSLWSGRLTEGTYIIEARRKSYRPTYRTVNVRKGEALDIDLEAPTPIYGILNINSQPFGANVYLDNIQLGSTPNIFNKILVGAHIVTIKETGYKDFKKEIKIGEDSICNLDVVMSMLPKTKYDKVEYVDLGLNVYWAKCNIGANSEYDDGNYYAWGETIPKDTFSYDNYKYWQDDKGMTKYVRNDILENIDDPVSVEYEGGWYTPSKQDWDELQNKCTWIWSDKGYTIKGNNGNTIFLPATGYYDAIDGFKGKGDETMYWTNQVSNHSDYESLSYFLSPQEHHFSIVTRWYGLPVRPVIAKTSLAKCDSTILNNNNISKVTNNETLDSTKEYNKVK